MGNSCSDICDSVINLMCRKCPNFKTCQNYEDEANHDQMLECISEMKMGKYPKHFSDCDGNSHNILYCADYKKRDQILFNSATINWDEPTNYHKEFEIKAETIKELADQGFIDLEHDDWCDNVPPLKDFYEMARDNPELTVKGICRRPTDENSKYDSGISFKSIDGKDIPLSRLEDLIYQCRHANDFAFGLENGTIYAWFD